MVFHTVDAAIGWRMATKREVAVPIGEFACRVVDFHDTKMPRYPSAIGVELDEDRLGYRFCPWRLSSSRRLASTGTSNVIVRGGDGLRSRLHEAQSR